MATEVGAVSFLWATSSVAWLMSIILVVIIISAALCLCGMSFEQVGLASHCSDASLCHSLEHHCCIHTLPSTVHFGPLHSLQGMQMMQSAALQGEQVYLQWNC